MEKRINDHQKQPPPLGRLLHLSAGNKGVRRSKERSADRMSSQKRKQGVSVVIRHGALLFMVLLVLIIVNLVLALVFVPKKKSK